MAFRLKGWSLQGFRSWAKDSIFHVPKTPGLYAIQGVNEVAPEKGANGVGKSQLIDALVWCFYGKTVCGLRGPQVKSWIADEPTVVAVDFEKDGLSFSLTRTQDPNSLNLSEGSEDPKVVDQEQVDKLIGMTVDQFMATVVLSAWGRPFLELGATDRLNALSRVLRLDAWESRAKHAKDMSSAGERVLADMREAVQKLLSEIDTREDVLQRARDALSVWEEDRSSRVKKLSRLVSATEKDLDALYVSLRHIEKRHIDAMEEAKRMRGELAPQKERIKSVEDDLISAKSKHVKLLDKKKDLKDALKEMESLEGAECPCCRQLVRGPHVEKVLVLLQDDLEYLEVDITKAATVVQETSHLLSVLRSRLVGCERGHEAKAEACRAIDAERRMTISKIEILQERVRAQKAEHNALLKESCPHEQTIEHQTEASSVARKELDRVSGLLDIETRRVACFQELAKTFKDLRLSVCEEAMHSFSASMSSALEQLGLSGWRVEASLDRPTKKGGEGARGFQLLIQSPVSPEWVPWETWSGGERQRLVLAGSVAFSDISCSRLGVEPSLEVWDEPTNHLSVEGTEDLSMFLKDRSTIKERVVLFIDHRTLDFGVFDGSFTVRGTAQGSVLA
jgi:DNA repair exonuclease SbcCD ATPase subunit